MKYKGYEGTVEFNEADNILHGRIIGIIDMVSFEGLSVDELRHNFEEAVDDYLEFCKEQNIEPNKPYKGSFNVRMNADLHRKASIYAEKSGKSLNWFVAKATEMAINQLETTGHWLDHSASKVAEPKKRYKKS